VTLNRSDAFAFLSKVFQPYIVRSVLSASTPMSPLELTIKRACVIICSNVKANKFRFSSMLPYGWTDVAGMCRQLRISE
jgi:hypothetical protein